MTRDHIVVDHFHIKKMRYCTQSRAVASLAVPGGQEFHFPHFVLKFRSTFLIFPQILLIFFLILALRVAELSTWEGPGYAIGSDGTNIVMIPLPISHMLIELLYHFRLFEILTFEPINICQSKKLSL